MSRKSNMTPDLVETIVDKIKWNYQCLTKKFRMLKDLTVGPAREVHASPIFFGNMVIPANGRILMIGEPGCAKTSLSSAISYITCGKQHAKRVTGHEDATLETTLVWVDPGKLIAQVQASMQLAGFEISKKSLEKPDLEELMKIVNHYKINMHNVVTFRPVVSGFACIVIDEISRFSEKMQNAFLELLHNGRVEYCGASVKRATRMAILNANWPAKQVQDRSITAPGTHRMVEALVSRAEICVIVPLPTYYDTDKIIDQVVDSNLNNKDMQASSCTRKKFSEDEVDCSDLEILKRNEMEAVQHATCMVPIDDEARHFINMVFTAMNACKYGDGSKGTMYLGFDCSRCNSCEQFRAGCLCSFFTTPMGVRAVKGTIRWTQATALLLGLDHVDVELVRDIIPYCIQAHAIPSDHFNEGKNSGSMLAYTRAYVDKVADFLDDPSVFEIHEAIIKCKSLSAASQLRSKFKSRFEKEPLFGAMLEGKEQDLIETSATSMRPKTKWK